MVKRSTLLGVLPAYTNTKTLIKKEQGTNDIIREIEKAHKLYAQDYDKISSFFWQGDPVSTAEYIFDFAKQNIQYCIEPDVRQSVKSPAAIIATGIYDDGYNDCKHYSLFIAGILDSLKRMGYDIDWNFRFASYQFFNSEPQHVFVVLKYNGEEFWIDPVLSSFNNRNPYTSKIDKKVNTMLYSISGIPKGQMNGTAIDIPADASKGAYVILLLNNFMNAATILNNCISKNSGAIQKYWASIGGNFNELVIVANDSKNKPPVQTDSKIVAIAYPILSFIAQCSNNPQAVDAAGISAQNLVNYNLSGTIGSVLTEVASVANVIPGVGPVVSTGINLLSNLFGSATPPPTAAQYLQMGIAALNSSFASGGLPAVYAQFADKGGKGDANTFRLGSDYDTIFVSAGASQLDATGCPVFSNSGVKLSTNYGGNAKDLFTQVLAAWPSAPDPTCNQSYWTAMQNFLSTGATASQALATGLFSSGSAAPVTPLAASAASNAIAPLVTAAAPVMQPPANGLTTSNLLLYGGIGLGVYLLSRKK